MSVALSPADREVLVLLARGRTARQIAGQYGWSLPQTHRAFERAYWAVGALTSSSAVARGHERGLLPLDEYPRFTATAEQERLLILVAAGWSNARIAGRIGYSAGSVGRMLHDLYGLAGAANRPNAVHIGFCTGLLGGASAAALGRAA